MSNDTDHCPVCRNPLPTGSVGPIACPTCRLRRGLNEDPGDQKARDAATRAVASVATPPRVHAGGRPSGRDPETDSPGSTPGRWISPTAEALDGIFSELHVTELIGRGGMGAVYRAKQTLLDREVALKILAPRLGEDPQFVDRFLREARTLARLNHPGLVTIHDFGRRDADGHDVGSEGVLFLLMELVDGVNLREAVAAESMTTDTAMEVVLQVSESLKYAHAAGVVHRDIKPENILIERSGRVRLVDFGLAKTSVAEERSLTATHQVMGTMHYMAPEQWETPTHVDHRADLYSLGVVFYELLTGDLPVGRFDLPSERGVHAEGLDEVVVRTLKRRPSERYQSAGELNDEVSRLSENHEHRGTPNGSSATGEPTARSGHAAVDTSPPPRDEPDGGNHAARVGLSTWAQRFHPGLVLGGTGLMFLAAALALIGITRFHPLVWIGLGLAVVGTVLVATAFQDAEDPSVRPRRTFHPGPLFLAIAMVNAGTTFLSYGFPSPFAWVGMAVTAAGSFVAIGTWQHEPTATPSRPWNRPQPSVLLFAIGFFVIGQVVMLIGILGRPVPFLWIGLAMTIAGGSIGAGAWSNAAEGVDDKPR